MIAAYYNENDPYAAEWLRNLIKAGHIAPGFVDERDIRDVRSEDLEGFVQCHFFAGIGVWSYALRRAGWPDDRPIWTGSCPCQPFSGAGKRGGFADERHLWPVWFNLIRERRPGVCIGEQVASSDGLGWWDSVQDSLEDESYASAALDLCVPGIGGPHIRQRLYWMADALPARRTEGWAGTGCGPASGVCASSGLVDAARIGHGTNDMEPIAGRREFAARPADGACAGGTGDSLCDGPHRASAAKTIQSGDRQDGRLQQRVGSDAAGESATGPVNGFWRAADWLFCRDGKWRPVEPGTFPLAHGAANRVGRLRAYGNAIVAEQAAEFVKAVSEELGYA